jgi:hypothetical protein
MVVETKKKIMMQKLLFFLIFKETQPNKTKTSKIKINLFETLRINIFIGKVAIFYVSRSRFEINLKSFFFVTFLLFFFFSI